MKRLLIIDALSLIHRAYHALPKLTTKKGELVNAVYGFLLVFFKTTKEFQPDFVAACFDLPGPTFRHKEFKEYKAKRPKAPDELTEQIPKTKEVLRAFSVPIFEKQGFEGDDILATIARKSQANSNIQNSNDQNKKNKEKMETIILSGDLDILQLVDENTKVYALKKGVKDTVLYDEEMVFGKYGLFPTQLPDYKALVGDQSDNIPGVPGIGPKTATKLLQKFGTLENLYEKLQVPNSKSQTNSKFKVLNNLKKKLFENKEQAFLSKKLAVVRKDVDLDFDLKKCQWEKYDKEKAVEILRKFEFHRLTERLSLLDKSPYVSKNTRKLL